MPVETKAQNLVYQTQDDPSKAATVIKSAIYSYLTSTVAPASTNFFWIAAASSLLTPSLIGLGAPSTRSFASFRPRLVTSRTALITLILLAPAAIRITLNSVFSSAAGAAAAPPPAAGAAATAAAAETPKASSIPLTSCDASSSVKPLICSSIAFTSAMSLLRVFEISAGHRPYRYRPLGLELVLFHRLVQHDGEIPHHAVQRYCKPLGWRID